MSLNFGTSLLTSAGMKIISVLVSFLFTYVITREFNIDDSGAFFAYITVITIAANASRFGFDAVLVRYLSVNASFLKLILLKATAIIIPLSIIFSILAYYSLQHMQSVVNVIINNDPFLIFLSVAGMALIYIFGSTLQGLQRFISSLFITGVSLNLLFLISLNTLSFPDVTTGLILYTTWISLIATSLLVYFTFKFWGAPSDDLPWSRVISKCFTFWVVVLAAQVTQWGGHLAAALFLQSSEVSLYNVASRVAACIPLLLVVVNYVAAPYFSKLYESNQVDDIHFLSAKIVRVLFLSAVPLALILVFFSDAILALFGPEYVSASIIFNILIFGQVVNVITGPVGIILNMTNNEVDSRNIMIVTWGVGLPLIFISADVFGVLGIAFCWTLCLIVQNLLNVIYVRKRLKFNPLLRK